MSEANTLKIAVAAVAAVALWGCDGGLDGEGPPPGAALKRSDVALQPVASCADLKDYVAESLIAEFTTGGGGGFTLEGGTALAEDASATDGASGGSSGGGGERATPDDVSQTNVQEAGVDEPDLVKTAADGTMVVVGGGYLSAIDAFPPVEAALAGTVAVSGRPYELFVDFNAAHAVAFGSASGPRFVADGELGGDELTDYPGAADVDGGPFNAARLSFVDITDATAPATTGTLFLEGWYLTARRTGSRIHAVTAFRPSLPAALDDDQTFWELVWAFDEAWWRAYGDVDWSDDDAVAVAAVGKHARLAPAQSTLARLGVSELRARITAKIEAAIAATDVRSLLPRSVWRTPAGADEALGLVGCTDVYRPRVAQSGGYVVVTSIDFDGGDAAAAAVMAPAGLVYATAEQLYVAQTSQGWWWSWDQPAQTAIHQFGFAGTQPVYRASGLVDGWVYGQFAFSDYQGFLRVATTADRVDEASGSFERANNLFVLERNGAALEVTGAVRGFGPDERIYSVRYVGDTGYVVTFRQTDPLFVFDLADPRAPELLGHVEIPGFSTYMHPLDADHLLTIGVAGDDDGITGGVDLSIFAVGDPTAPARLFSHTIAGSDGWGWSPAQYDHRAFTFDAVRGVLAIPLVTYGEEPFAGIAAFSVDADAGIAELGRIDHAHMAFSEYCSGDNADNYECESGDVAWRSSPRRAVLMSSGDDTFVYAISNLGITASDIDAVDVPLAQVDLPVNDEFWWY